MTVSETYALENEIKKLKRELDLQMISNAFVLDNIKEIKKRVKMSIEKLEVVNKEVDKMKNQLDKIDELWKNESHPIGFYNAFKKLQEDK